MPTGIESIIDSTRARFIAAKSDGVLDAAEVVQIAVDVAAKLQKLGPLSGKEKRALVLMALKKGLEAAGGVEQLPGLKEATLAEKEAFEQQLLVAAGAALDAVVAVATGKIQLKKPATWLACLPFCSVLLKVAVVIVPKDQEIVREALTQASQISSLAAAQLAPSEAAEAPAVAVPEQVSETQPPSQESQTATESPQTSEKIEEVTLHKKQDEKEPSPVASFEPVLESVE